VAAIQSGLVHGYLGMVEGILSRIREEVSFEFKVVSTGGFATVVAEQSSSIDVVDDTLVLEGLRLIHARNRGSEVAGVA
jgi:type III pantothenate kinase